MSLGLHSAIGNTPSHIRDIATLALRAPLAALPAHQPQPVELPREAGYIAPGGAIVVVGYNDMREVLHPLASTVFPKLRPVTTI